MDKVTEARAVLSPKRRVSSDTLMTGSLTLEPPIVARRVRRSTRHQSRPLAQKDVCRAFTCDVLRAFVNLLSTSDFLLPASIALPDRLDIDGDGHTVTNDHSSFVNRVVPTHTEVMTIDLSGRDKARAQLRPLVDPVSRLLFPPWCFPLTEVADRKWD